MVSKHKTWNIWMTMTYDFLLHKQYKLTLVKYLVLGMTFCHMTLCAYIFYKGRSGWYWYIYLSRSSPFLFLVELVSKLIAEKFMTINKEVTCKFVWKQFQRWICYISLIKTGLQFSLMIHRARGLLFIWSGFVIHVYIRQLPEVIKEIIIFTTMWHHGISTNSNWCF